MHCFKFHRRTVRTKKHSERHARGQGKRSHFPRGSGDTPSVRSYGFSSNVEDRQLYAGSGDVPGYTQISVETSERWLLGHARDR